MLKTILELFRAVFVDVGIFYKLYFRYKCLDVNVTIEMLSTTFRATTRTVLLKATIEPLPSNFKR